MKTARLEAFSDGVIAIIITIMVLELKVPHPFTVSELVKRLPVFLSYVLSFFVVAVMWVNHHHLIHSARTASAALLWANVHLLFWMSLIPFATGCIGENISHPVVVAMYGAVLACSASAFIPLRQAVVAQTDEHDHKQHHRKRQWKNAASALCYLTGSALAFVSIAASLVIYAVVPLVYFIPGRSRPQARTSV